MTDQQEHIYALALFDCCRSAMPANTVVDEEGVGNRAGFIERQFTVNDGKIWNCMISHAGSPGQTVSQQSCFIPEFFKFMQQEMIKWIQGKPMIKFPGKIGNFRGSSGTVETLCLTQQNLWRTWNASPTGIIFPEEEKKEEEEKEESIGGSEENFLQKITNTFDNAIIQSSNLASADRDIQETTTAQQVQAQDLNMELDGYDSYFIVNGKKLMEKGEKREWSAGWLERMITSAGGEGKCVTDIWIDRLKCSL